MKKLLFVIAALAMMLGCKQSNQQVTEIPWYENDSALQADLAVAIEDAKVLDSSKIVNDLLPIRKDYPGVLVPHDRNISAEDPDFLPRAQTLLYPF